MAPTAAVPIPVSTSGSLARISYRCVAIGAGTSQITARLRKNGTATGITVSFLPTAQSATFTLTTPITVTAGVDYVDLEVIKAGVVTASPTGCTFTIGA